MNATIKLRTWRLTVAVGKSKPNQFCPVQGCSTNAQHRDDADVKALLETAQTPCELARWATNALIELRDSIGRDSAERQIFALITRLRQVEELYSRTVYILLLVTDDELPHMLSGAMPNGFSFHYDQVNKSIFGGRGVLERDSKTMEMLHHTAHVSFWAMRRMVAFETIGEWPDFRVHLERINRMCRDLDDIRRRFAAGMSRAEVLDYLQHVHLLAPSANTQR
jgi:hypothetical protein